MTDMVNSIVWPVKYRQSFTKRSEDHSIKQCPLWLPFLTPQGMHLVAVSFFFTQGDWIDHGTHVLSTMHLFCNVTQLVSWGSYIYFIKICIYIASGICQSNTIWTVKQPTGGFINMTPPAQSFSYHICLFSSFQDDVFQLPLRPKNLLGWVKSVVVLFARTWCHTLGR